MRGASSARRAARRPSSARTAPGVEPRFTASVLDGLVSTSWLEEDPTQQLSRAALLSQHQARTGHAAEPPWDEEEATEIELDLSGALAAILERLPSRRRASSRAKLDDTRFAAPPELEFSRRSALRERTQPADLLVIGEEQLSGVSAVEIDLEDLEELDPALVVEL